MDAVKSLRLNLLIPTLIALCAMTNLFAMAQAIEAKIEKITPYETAVPGQMLSLTVIGIELESTFIQIPLADFTIDIVQRGVTFKAPVRSVNPLFKWEAKSSSLKTGVSVLFTVPKGLQEGEASLSLFHRGARNGSANLTIATRPLAPRLVQRIVAIGFPGSPSQPPPSKEPNAPFYKFERGREELIDVQPLFDPQEKEGAILIRFRQGSDIHQATAWIKHLPATESSGGRIVALRPSPQYEAYVKIPAGLYPGEARMEAQCQIGDQISEPTSVSALITDIAKAEENPRASAPRILSLSKMKVGIGQALEVTVERRNQLEPSPSQAVVILEQNGERYQLKPEFNSANFSQSSIQNLNASELVILRVRTRTDVLGPVKVKVLNPALGAEMGLSEGVPLEIADRPLPPTNVVIRESADSDVDHLRRMREVALKAGRQFRNYDPQYRYLTIQADNLEMDPKYLLVEIEWAGKSYRIKPDEFAMGVQFWIVFRLPEDVEPGVIQVTVANRGGENLSELVTRTVEITKPARGR